jgi:hypothetical protein
MARRGRLNAKRFTWERTAGSVRDMYNHLF